MKFVLTRPVYLDLIDALRDTQENVAEAARRVGVPYPSALHLHTKGWANVPWARAIKHVLAEEREEAARVRDQKAMAYRAEEEQKLATERAARLEARAEELLGSKASRKNAIGFALTSQKLVAASQKIAEEVNRRMSEPDSVQHMAFSELRALLQTCAGVVDKGERILRHALEIERIVTNQPIVVQEHRHVVEDPEEFQRELARLTGVLTRHQTRAKVIEGKPA